MSRLEGKVAVITGGNSGIGLATAQRFVAEGAYVFITGRRQSELDAAVKQIGKSITAVQGDVSSLADLDRLYATVKQQKGHIDILSPTPAPDNLPRSPQSPKSTSTTLSTRTSRVYYSPCRRRFRYLRTEAPSF